MANTLKVTHLSYQKGYNRLFNDLSFGVNAGNILRITGINGSGKTSLLKIIAGLNAADSGAVLLGDSPVKSCEYQAQIFYLGHQSILNTELSVFENLEFLMTLNQQNDEQNNQQNNHKILFSALANMGLEHFTNERCSTLSAGQKRRVILAGLFVANATVWLLDEPFTALDLAGIKIVEERIQQHSKQGGICLFTNHQSSALIEHKILAL